MAKKAGKTVRKKAKKAAKSATAKRAKGAKSAKTTARKSTTSKKMRPQSAAPRKAAAVAGAAASPRASCRHASGLTKKDIEYFRGLLLQKRRELHGDVQTLNEAGHNASGNLSTLPQHMADIGSDNYEQEFALSLMQGEQALLVQIEDALKRIEKGTFGVCTATGKPIGKARLKAKPWATFCYEHELAQEQGRRRGF